MGIQEIPEDDANEPIPEWKKELLEQRLAEHNQNPDSGITWEELKKRYYIAL